MTKLIHIPIAIFINIAKSFWHILILVIELLTENGIEIEAGPLRHGISQSTSLYAIEPGGNRVELYGEPSYHIIDPEWKPGRWTEKEVEREISFSMDPRYQKYFLKRNTTR